MTLSVRFYKRLILLVLLLMILIPTGTAIRLGAKSARLEKQLAAAGILPGDGQGQEDLPGGNNPIVSGTPIDYQLLHPELYGTARLSDQRIVAKDTVYLTFDCAPTANTQRILDILDEYGIKATFFLIGVTDSDNLEYMRQIVSRGHSIGLYSYSNSYGEIYESIESYLDDFQKIYDLVYETTGVEAEIFRFPGGSVNTYNNNFYQELIAEMLRRDFIFFDWNYGEGKGDETTPEGIKSNVFNTMEGQTRGIVALRDTVGHEAVVDALPDIITGLRDRGYSFQPLNATVMPVIFSYKSTP